DEAHAAHDQQADQQREIEVQAAQELRQRRGCRRFADARELAHCASSSSCSSQVLKTSRTTGSAEPLPPPFSTTTATARSGSSAGAKAMNRPWSRSAMASSSSLYSSSAPSVNTCAVPVLPAMRYGRR